MKTCTKCEIEKPLDEFGRNRSTKDGKQAWCKECRNKQYKEGTPIDERLISSKENHQVCIKCFIEKPEEEFELRSDTCKRRGDCDECRRKYHNKKRKNNRFYLNHQYKAKGYLVAENYFTIEDYDYFLEKQNNECPICEKEFNGEDVFINIDHCHNSDQVRGLLCSECNMGIGKLKDNINSLKNAINYLIKEEENEI